MFSHMLSGRGARPVGYRRGSTNDGSVEEDNSRPASATCMSHSKAELSS